MIAAADHQSVTPVIGKFGASILMFAFLGALTAGVSAQEASPEGDAPVAEGDEETPEGEEPGESEPAEPEAEESESEESTPADPEVETGETEEVAAPPPAGLFVAPEYSASDPAAFNFTLPPLHIERGADVDTTAIFPFLYIRETHPEGEPGTSELVVPPFYHREGELQADVLFPAFWYFRGQGHHTLAVPPFWSRQDPSGWDVGLFPLGASGARRSPETGRQTMYYHAIPGLLSAAWGTPDEDVLVAGGLFYRWRLRDDERFGLFPLLWARNSPTEEYLFAAPFYFRWRNPELSRTLTLVPPGLFYHQQDRNESFWGIAGLLHHNEGPGFHSTTIPPLLFHFSEGPDAMRLATPAFMYLREGGSETLVSWLYQRYRGATEFDAVLPLFANVHDPRDHSYTQMFSPLFWHWGHPGANNWLLFPLFAHLETAGLSRNTWIVPNIQISNWHDGNAVNVHPFFYYENVRHHRFIVIPPLLYADWENFQGPERTRTTVSVPTLTYYRRIERRRDQSWEWEVHIFPFFDMGQRSDGESWWRVLYGLAGHEHRRRHDRDWVFYVPIDHSHAPFGPADPTSDEAEPSDDDDEDEEDQD